MWLKRRDVSATDEMAAILKRPHVDMRRGLTTFFRSLKPVDLSESERSGPIKPCNVRYEGRFSANDELRSIGAARKKFVS